MMDENFPNTVSQIGSTLYFKDSRPYWYAKLLLSNGIFKDSEGLIAFKVASRFLSRLPQHVMERKLCKLQTDERGYVIETLAEFDISQDVCVDLAAMLSDGVLLCEFLESIEQSKTSK